MPLQLSPLKPLLLNRTLRLLLSRVSYFHTTPPASQPRIYDSIRSTDTFHTLLLTHTASYTPLITYWTTTYCPTCRTVKPPLWRTIEKSTAKIGLVEVELDAPGAGVGELGLRYTIRKVPTILVFVRGESVPDWRVEAGDERMRGDGLERFVEQVGREGRWGGRG